MEKFTNRLLKPIKKTLGLVGAIGVGYLGGIQEGQAKDSENLTDVKPRVGQLSVEQNKNNKLLLENADGATKFVRHVREDFNPQSFKLVIDEGSFKMYKQGKFGKDLYAIRDERYGETFYIYSKDDDHAGAYARRFYKENPKYKESVQQEMKDIEKLQEDGVVYTEEAKNGFLVVGSERLESGKKVCTKVKYFQTYDHIEVYTVDENDQIVGSQKIRKGDSSFEEYMNIFRSSLENFKKHKNF